jgi:hypothetical protein
MLTKTSWLTKASYFEGLLFWLVLAVMLGVVTAGLDMVMFGMAGVTVGGNGMVRRLFVIAGLMMPGRFAMVLGRVLMMLGSLVMVLNACVVAHVALPVRC